MKNILFLAFRYLRFNKIKTVILVFSIAVGVFLPLAVNLLVSDYQRDLLARADATPLIAGAPGSRLDLVLHGLYFRGKPAHDLTMADANAIHVSRLGLAVPVLCKHAARGLPVVGTTLEYFEFRRLSVVNGAGLMRLGDCVLGATASEKLGLKPGDKLMSDPENVFDLAGSYPLNMHVTGVLAPKGTADDGAVFVDLKTAWLIMGLIHGHQDVTKADPNLLLSRDTTNVTASAALLSYQEVTRTNMASFHMHGDPMTYPVDAVIVMPHDEKSSAILRGRYQDVKSTVQLLVPRQVVSETLDLVFRVKRFFDVQAGLVGVATALLLALVVLLSLRLRRGEMETMFKIGCARHTIFLMQATEILIVLVVGIGFAGGLSWFTLQKFRLGSNVLRPVLEAPHVATARKRVAVTNYPLKYFTDRIAGKRVDILFPVSREEDPAFWKPTEKDIEQYQKADFILLNGAEYEKWLPTTVLPLMKQVITSAAFADRYATNGEVVTHSHGPGGMHSHGLIDFNTWMDPSQAALQAQSVHDELVRLLPEATREFGVNLALLQKDLAGLDVALAKIPLKEPLLGSHPVYQYVARRYGWNLQSVHWEPDEMPSEEEWQKLEELHRRHPATLMIWEEEPLPAVAERLRKMGIEPVAFQTCANEESTGNYLVAMKANASRLASHVRN